MANSTDSNKWYFTKEQLENTPSRLCGFDAYKELQYRQQAANFIQDMGQRLKVSQLCINTAIVYMHRFYVFHSFTDFPWYQMAAAALFLAAKVEEQPRKLEYVIRVANICKNPRDSSFDVNSERYAAQSQDLVFNENVLLQTLGFDVAIDHPHTYVVRCCHLVRASKDLAQTSYFMASNSLHLTTMCIQYKPTVVACFCILLACKWSNWEIPLSNEKKEWFTYVDATVTAELLEQLTSEFLVIFENCPSRLKEKIMAKQENFNSPAEQDKKQESVPPRSLDYKGEDPHKHRSRPHDPCSSGHRSQEQKEREYKERKEKERIAHMSGIVPPYQSHHHRSDRPQIDPKMKPHARPSSSSYLPPSRSEPRDILREASKEPSFGLPNIHEPNREHVKDPMSGRSDKEVPKRDPLLKPNVQTDLNSLNNYVDVRQRLDPSRPRIDSKSASKQELIRRYEEPKPHAKSETDNIKKHLSSSYDKNSAYMKSSSSTSQKIKSPFNLDNKSVPKTNSSQAGMPTKQHYNGNTNGSYNKILPNDHDVKIKTEAAVVKEEIPTPAVIKRPSLFSPEKSPPQMKTEKSDSLTHLSITNLTALSPINSPPNVQNNRRRNYSSSSEPELRPTMKKIDEVEGFENLMRDNTIGVHKVHNSAENVLAIKEGHHLAVKSEAKLDTSPVKDPSAPQSANVNGLETNPIIISNLLKEAATNPHLSGVTAPIKSESVEASSSLVAPPPEYKEKDHHHHKSKKKKEKHKHKDKEKSKDEKEKKKKHKDKEKEKHKHKERKEETEPHPIVSEPIKIKIQKDKIQPPNEGLKIKIPKDKIKTEGIMEPLPQPSSGGLKIKIPKEIITNCSTGNVGVTNSVDLSVSSSSIPNRKRERGERSLPTDAPPLKQIKMNHKESKQNGRPSYAKVSQNIGSSEYLDNNAPVVIHNESTFVNEKSVKIVSPIVSPVEATERNNNDSKNVRNIAYNLDNTTSRHQKSDNNTALLDSSGERQSSNTPPLIKPDLAEPSDITATNSLNSNVTSTKSYNLGVNNNAQTNINIKNNNNAPYQKSNKHNGSDDYSLHNNSHYNSKNVRGGYNQHPLRYPRNSQPRHPLIQRHQTMNYRPHPPQNPYQTAPPPITFTPYQIPPPIMPNMNVPPPPYNMYSYYTGYMFPNSYQPPGNMGGLNLPPLPMEAPPSDIPPPPPPEEG